jgi:hypothetical protein
MKKTQLINLLEEAEALVVEHHAYGVLEHVAPVGICPVCGKNSRLQKLLHQIEQAKLDEGRGK